MTVRKFISRNELIIVVNLPDTLKAVILVKSYFIGLRLPLLQPTKAVMDVEFPIRNDNFADYYETISDIGRLVIYVYFIIYIYNTL